jgi:hypothetical protein
MKATRFGYSKATQTVAAVLGQRPDRVGEEPQKDDPKSGASLSGTRLDT